jgi:hypothetical protein
MIFFVLGHHFSVGLYIIRIFSANGENGETDSLPMDHNHIETFTMDLSTRIQKIVQTSMVHTFLD